MVPANQAMIAVFALIVWRFVFGGLRRRPFARAIATAQEHQNNVLEQRFPILEQARAGVIAEDSFGNGSDDIDLIDRTGSAKTYLLRIVTLTGAMQMDNDYVLDVGKMRFYVRHRYVRRLRDVTDPKCGYEETCFYPVHKGMPNAEEIATALLQLTNNPALFDKWAVQNGLAFKADGQVFRGAQ